MTYGERLSIIISQPPFTLSNTLTSVLKSIAQLGLKDKHDPIDLARSKVINLLIVSFVVLTGLLAIYRFLFYDFWDLCFPNLVLCFLFSIPLVICYIGKHQLAFRIITFYLLLFVFELNRPDTKGLYVESFRTSIVVYLTLIPFMGAMLNKSDKGKFITYLASLLLFNYFHFQWEATSSTFLTYNISLSIFCLALVRFMKLIESNQALLNYTLAEKTEALEALQLRNQQLNEFSRICSHDLKEPIRSISSYNKLIKRSLGNNISKTQYEYFDFVNKGVQIMDKIVEGLKEYTSINNPIITQNKTFDLIELIENIIKETKEKFENKNIQTHLINSSNSREIYNAPEALKIVFEHLFSNSIIHNTSDVIEIKISVNENAEGIYFSIEDNGQGINEKFESYIFEPFKTMENKSSKSTAGLGLFNIKKVLERINGHIWFESNLGHGSIFHVQLCT